MSFSWEYNLGFPLCRLHLKHSNLARLKPCFVGQASLHVTRCRCSKLLILLWNLAISSWTHCCWCKGCSAVCHPFKRYSSPKSFRSCSSWRLALRRTESFCLKTCSRCSLSSLLSFWIRTAWFCRCLSSRCCLCSSVSFWNLVAEFSRVFVSGALVVEVFRDLMALHYLRLRYLDHWHVIYAYLDTASDTPASCSSVPLSPADGFAADFQVSCSAVPLSPGDGVAFVGLSGALAAPQFLVVAFFASVRVGFQVAVLALPGFRW